MFIINHQTQEVHRIDQHTFTHSSDLNRFLWVHRYNVIIPIRNQSIFMKNNNINNI